MASKLKTSGERIQPAGHGEPRPVALHVVPVEGGWAVRVGRRIETTIGTREEAVALARSLARKRGAEVIMHSRSGRFRYPLSTSRADATMLELWREIRATGPHRRGDRERGGLREDPAFLQREGRSARRVLLIHRKSAATAGSDLPA